MNTSVCHKDFYVHIFTVSVSHKDFYVHIFTVRVNVRVCRIVGMCLICTKIYGYFLVCQYGGSDICLVDMDNLCEQDSVQKRS